MAATPSICACTSPFEGEYGKTEKVLRTEGSRHWVVKIKSLDVD
jgi:hypothetical protein